MINGLEEMISCNKKTIPIPKYKLEELESRLNFLFIAHNDIEFGQLLKVLLPLDGYKQVLEYVDCENMQNYYIGKFYKYDIVLAKTADMGSVKVNAAINVINRAIMLFRPLYIVMPGIAAGMGKEVNIGDVVIANKIIGYESEKIGANKTISRCPEYSSYRLLNLFSTKGIACLNNALLEEKRRKDDEIINNDEALRGDPQVHIGSFLSGEKLVDNNAFRRGLIERFPEAKALDMEGIGIASASIFNRVYDWLIIKGISDLGDGMKGKNKESRQVNAMRNVIAVLKVVFDNEFSFTEASLKRIKNLRKNVLISSSQCKEGKLTNFTTVFLEKLATKLIENDFNVITGYGIGVGPSIMRGLFQGCENLGLPLNEYSERFKQFPFPRKDDDMAVDEANHKEFMTKNRELMCSGVDICLFAFGNKVSKDGKIIAATGMESELILAKKNCALPVPIGVTLGTAKKIYNKYFKEAEQAKQYLLPYFEKQLCDADMDKDSLVEDFIEDLKSICDGELNESNMDETIKNIISIIKKY